MLANVPIGCFEVLGDCGSKGKQEGIIFCYGRRMRKHLHSLFCFISIFHFAVASKHLHHEMSWAGKACIQNKWLTSSIHKEILQTVSFSSTADPGLLPYTQEEWFTIHLCINEEMQKITTLHACFDFIHPFSSSTTLMGWDSYLDKQNLLDAQTDAISLPAGDNRMTSSMTNVAGKF